jgi:Uncharacterized conserved protein
MEEPPWLPTWSSSILLNREFATSKDSPKRAAAATELAQDFGVEIRDIFWTLGAFDGAVLMEAPNDQAVPSLALKLVRLATSGRRSCVLSAPTRSKISLRKSTDGGRSQRGGIDRFEIGCGDRSGIELRGPLSGRFRGQLGQLDAGNI